MPRAMPVVELFGGDASGVVCVRRPLAAAAAVLYSSSRNMYYFEVCVFWLKFLLVVFPYYFSNGFLTFL